MGEGQRGLYIWPICETSLAGWERGRGGGEKSAVIQTSYAIVRFWSIKEYSLVDREVI